MTVLLRLSPLLFLSVPSKGTQKPVHLLNENHREISCSQCSGGHIERHGIHSNPVFKAGLPWNPSGPVGGWHAVQSRRVGQGCPERDPLFQRPQLAESLLWFLKSFLLTLDAGVAPNAGELFLNP